MWKGSISFGLVSIPIKLYAATEEKDIKFNYLHEPCRTPIRYQKSCPTCDREVTMEEVVRGYEYEKGRYIIFQDQDFEQIPVAAARTVDIVDFVHLEDIDPVYFARTYYLEPGEGGNKAYHLLRMAMEDTGRIAIARIVMRSKESLAAIRVYKHNVLAMETMHYPDEIRSVAGLTGVEAVPEIRPQELEMARGLITSLSGEFLPEKFRNEYREELVRMIQQKIAGEEVVTPAAAPERARVVDLMEALRASIRVAEEARDKEAAEHPAAAARAPGLPAAAQGVPGVVPGVPPVPAASPIPGLPSAPTPGLPAQPTAAPIPGLPVAPAGPGATATGLPGVPADRLDGRGAPDAGGPAGLGIPDISRFIVPPDRTH